ncbi:SEC-C metal-binding domain-containing protein [Sporosarcina siberiensis]|uniref:SEC-C metal-binding domain-containing protein n=1 Tax=Sporosarcina siberiensis TaxID=1365606 RepID=A0ABW4SD03_9BACL
MIGRNDPCPCGSGQKYKKCCAGKSDVPVEQLVDEELERILSGVYDLVSDPKSAAEFDGYLRSWTNKLVEFFDEETIEVSVSEYFLFVAREDLWKRYLMKVLNSSMRSGTRSVVESWQAPIVLFGTVKAEQNDFLEIEENLGEKTYFLEIKDEMRFDIGSIVFGVVLPDDRNHPNGIKTVTSLLFVRQGSETIKENVVALAESSGLQQSKDFYKKHMLDIYKIIVEAVDNPLEDIIDNELSEAHRSVMDSLTGIFEMTRVDIEEQQLLKSVGVMYLLEEQPNFRKPNVVSAGMFQAGIDLGIISLSMTQADVAQLFDVSVGAMAKRAEEIAEFAIESLEQQKGISRGPRVVRSVGTYPLLTERVNWEMSVKLSRKHFDTLEAMQTYMTLTMNEPFQPKGEMEQAQTFIYDAYEADNNQVRYELAEKALRLDPENPDVYLIRAERTEIDHEAEHLYKTAIEYAESRYEAVDENPWGLVTNRPYMRALFAYGVWLFNKKRYDEAGRVFNDLLEMNPDDNQGARYLAISSYIETEDFEAAEIILDEYEENSETDAAYLYLRWYLEACMSEGESVNLDWMFEEAMEENPFVAEMLDSDDSRPLYPKRLDCDSGSFSEAMYIMSLLH